MLYPEPQRFKEYSIQPQEAFYYNQMREVLLPYDAVRSAKSPDEVLWALLQSTYEEAAAFVIWIDTYLSVSKPSKGIDRVKENIQFAERSSGERVILFANMLLLTAALLSH